MTNPEAITVCAVSSCCPDKFEERSGSRNTQGSSQLGSSGRHEDLMSDEEGEEEAAERDLVEDGGGAARQPRAPTHLDSPRTARRRPGDTHTTHYDHCIMLQQSFRGSSTKQEPSQNNLLCKYLHYDEHG